jgi:hypothetical protein
MNTNHENLLANALRDVLTVAGVIRKGAEPNGAELLMFAEDYIKHQSVSSGEVSDLLSDWEIGIAYDKGIKDIKQKSSGLKQVAQDQHDHDNRPDSLIRQDEKLRILTLLEEAYPAITTWKIFKNLKQGGEEIITLEVSRAKFKGDVRLNGDL